MEENNNNFSDDLKPSKEDIELRQRQLQTKRTTSTRGVASSSPNGLVVAAFLVAFVATGVGGFALWKLMAVQDKLSQADAFLSKLDSATETLQESVSEAGAKASLSAGALKSLVKENNSEIRKLWHVANERNKKAIQANKKSISAYKQEMRKQQQAHKQEVEASIVQLEVVLSDKLERQRQAYIKLESRISQLRKSVSSLPDVELRMGQNEELLQDLESQLKSLNKQVKELRASKP